MEGGGGIFDSKSHDERTTNASNQGLIHHSIFECETYINILVATDEHKFYCIVESIFTFYIL